MASLSDVTAELDRRAALESAAQLELGRRQMQAATTPPIPEPEFNRVPKNIEEATGGIVSRPLVESAAGMAGFVAGGGAGLAAGLATGPAAPVAGPLGAVAVGEAGSALASGAATFGYDALENFLKENLVLGGEQKKFGDTARDALQTGSESLLGGAVGHGVGAAIGAVKPFIGKILGVRGEEAGKLSELAKQYGIDMKPRELMRGIRRTGADIYSSGVGVFPWIGGPQRTAGRKQAAQLEAAFSKNLNLMAPNATLMSDLSVDMVAAAKNTSKTFRDLAGQLNHNFMELAKSNNARIPTTKIWDVAIEVIGDVVRGNVKLKNGEDLPGALKSELTDFVSDLTKLPDTIDILQYRAQIRNLQEAMSKASASGADVSFGVKVKAGFEAALSEIEGAKETKEALQAFNSFYSKGVISSSIPTTGGRMTVKNPGVRIEGGIDAFKTPEAKDFQRVDKAIFKGGPDLPGNLNADEFRKVLGSLKDSANGVKNLRKLVGEENMNQYVRNTVQDALDKSVRYDEAGAALGVDWKAFKKQAGVGSPGFEEMVRGTGVDPKSFDDLIEISSKISIPASLSKFVARRAQLGGLRAALNLIPGISAGSAVAGAGAGTAAVGGAGAVLPIILLRYSQTLLNNPKQVEQLRRAFMPGVPQTIRNAAAGRVLQFLEGQSEGQPNG